jgi:hypothetical protein
VDRRTSDAKRLNEVQWCEWSVTGSLRPHVSGTLVHMYTCEWTHKCKSSCLPQCNTNTMCGPWPTVCTRSQLHFPYLCIAHIHIACPAQLKDLTTAMHARSPVAYVYVVLNRVDRFPIVLYT